MALIDITMPLSEGVPVWPGDTEFHYELNWTKEETGSVNVGTLTMSTHTGTHIDAPYHYDDEGKKVNQLDLNLYLGTCTVIHCISKNTIDRNDLINAGIKRAERLLVKTGGWNKRNKFPETFPIFTESAVELLAESGVRLLGVDVPSVDPVESKDLPIHHALYKKGIHIMEGLVLNDVEPGQYDLLALPLSLDDADASPVRAVLKR